MSARTCARCPAFLFAPESLASGLCHGCRSPAPTQRVVLASGVSEKGRMLYAMYEKRFGKKPEGK